jgi:hypothetical protein
MMIKPQPPDRETLMSTRTTTAADGRPAPRGLRARPAAALLAASLLTLTGCGPNGFARDSLVENKGAEDFLDRIQKNCAKLSVGDQPLNWLLSTASNDVTFIDLTSKLYLGQFSPKDYTDGINAAYPTGTNQPALDCIFKQR